MKRPRFGLKLILLLVALVAVWLAWFHVKGEQRNADWERKTFDLRRQVDELTSARSAIVERFKDVGAEDLGIKERRQRELEGFDIRVKELQDQIDAVER